MAIPQIFSRGRVLGALFGAGLILGTLSGPALVAAAGAQPAAAAAPSAPAPGAPGSHTAPSITLPGGPGSPVPGDTTGSGGAQSGRSKVAAVLGAALLIGMLYAFSQGYGILGGRSKRSPRPSGPGRTDEPTPGERAGPAAARRSSRT